MTDLTNANIRNLLNLFQPFFFFDPTEQFFPSTAEEALGHQSRESWATVTTHQRGTAILRTPLATTVYSSADVQAGVDSPAGSPVTFDAAPPDGIGQDFGYHSEDQDLFLDVAGWDDTEAEVPAGTAAYTTGSMEYLQQLFSGLGHSMNAAIPVQTPNPRPRFSVPRSTTPTVYAELEWAGRYPVLDQERVERVGGNADFPPVAGSATGRFAALDNYLALTYYLFYPAAEASPIAAPTPDTDRMREGQWEAVTVFLKGQPDFAHTDRDGRPDFPFGGGGALSTHDTNADLRGLTPRFVAYSTGYAFGDDSFNPLAAQVQPWPDAHMSSALSVVGRHPQVFVTAGTHRNLFAIDATVTPGTSTPDTALNTTGGAFMGAAGTAMGICALLVETVVAFVVCVIIAAVIFLIGLILFILSFLFPDTSPQTETPQSSAPGSDVARDDGPAAIPSIPGTTVTTLASATVVPQLRVVTAYGLDGTPPVTTFPLPSPLPAGTVEMPSWWSFPGRWGVRVTPLFNGAWDSGTRRTDPFGRSRGYWNTYQLVDFVAASGGSMSL